MKNKLSLLPLALVAVAITVPVTSQAFQNKKQADFKKLGIKDIKPGKGYAAKDGDTVEVLYLGTFRDGKKFDGNMDAKYNATGPSFSFTVGKKMVIPGWDKGLVGAKVGTVRKLEVPWSMAYGERGAGGVIPPKTDLLFTVKVLKITKG
jgi:FKBP-type peptidyl-prolyl cis-trans isomerase